MLGQAPQMDAEEWDPGDQQGAVGGGALREQGQIQGCSCRNGQPRTPRWEGTVIFKLSNNMLEIH